MRKFIISATVAIVAAVSFAAPSQAGGYGYGNYGYKSYGYGHKSYGHKHYGYKKSHSYKPYRFVKKWKKPHGYHGRIVIRKGYGYY